MTQTQNRSARLSEDEVLRRMFMPSTSLPEPRNREAIVIVTAGENERSVTHRQVENLFAGGVEQLKQRGIAAGDKVVFFCENCPEITSLILACWAEKAMVALIDYRAQHADVLSLSKKFGAKLVVTSKKMYTDYARESKMFTDEKLDILEISSLTDLKDVAATSAFDVVTLDLDSPAFAILTSGTTGTPKTAVHTLRSLVVNIIDLVETANQKDGNITALMPLPISHVFGLTVFLIAQVLGAKTVLTPLEPVAFVKAVHRHKPEWIAALPQFYGALLSAPKGFIKLDNAKLLLCGGAPPAVSLTNKFEETFGKKLNNGYGSTECKLVAFNVDGGPVLSVGRPAGQIIIDVVNEQDEILPEGEVGEVRITGPMLMDGYLDNDKETRKVLRNGHYYTGDIGRLQDGYLFVAGRKSDTVTVAGVVVECGEVEEVLRNFPEVKDVAVTAVPSKRLGQLVKASVVLVDEKISEKLKSAERDVRDEANRDLQRHFKAYCKQHLSRHQLPMKWRFFGSHDSLPKTLAGKTDKKRLQD